jgi:LmbE family N-acetylglucosaminyl deacetylase
MPPAPTVLANDGVERVLVITAHPDDVDFGAAGSVATWTDTGIEVTYCLVTNGDAGGSDRAQSREEMARLRQEEQRAAAAIVGVHDLRFLGYPDGRLEATLDLRRDLSRVIRQVRPQRVVAQSPERLLDRIFASHPDHLAAGEAALSAVYPDSRNPFAHPELLDEGWEPWTVGEVLLMASRETDVVVDTTDALDRKVAALRCHGSQHDDPTPYTDLLRTWGAAAAASAGLPEGHVAEAFRRVVTA